MTTNDRRLPSLQVALRRHWVMVLVIALCGLGAGQAYTLSLERTFTASAVVLLNPLPANPLTPEAASGSGAQFNVALETEAEVVASPAVAEGVSERLSRLVPEQGEYLDVGVPTGTQMVRISFTTVDRTGAEDGAQAFAEVFLEYREDRAADHIQTSLTALKAGVEELESELEEALSDDPGTGSLSARQVDLSVDRLAALNSQISTLEGTATDPGRVLQPAQQPSGSNEPSTPVLLAVALVLALGLGMVIAWYREWRSDPTVETAALEVAGVPILAAVPKREGESPATDDGAVHEAYRHVRAGIVANVLRPHTLAVCGTGADLDAPTVASNLAVVLAEARYSVLLIAADPEDRTVESVMGLDDASPGLADVLVGKREPSAVLVHRGELTVLPGGCAPEAARELYAGPRFRKVLEELRGSCDFIILSTAGTANALADGVTSTADSVLLAVTTGTTHAQVEATVDRYARLGVRTIGAVAMPEGRAALVKTIDETTTQDHDSRVDA